MNQPKPRKPFQPIQKVRAFEEVAARIRTELVEGGFKAGDKLASERELCEQFQVSRNTLREALRSLENAGILESRKGATGGAYVTQVTGDAVVTGLSDMYQLGTIKPIELIRARIWIESAAIRVAAEHITPDEIQAMASNIAEADQATGDGNFELRIQLNLDFHRMIAKATRNEVMVTMLEALLNATHHVILKVGPYDNEFVPKSRRRFLKLLAAGDAEGAVKEMEYQLTRVGKIYAAKLAEKVQLP